jgi:cell shape-determining protein MreC
VLERVGRRRIEVLLALSLLLPIGMPHCAPAATLVAGLFAAVPAPAPPPPDERGAENEAQAALVQRLTQENARLRERLFAKGDPAKLVALDTAFFSRHPRRIEAEVRGRDSSPWRGSLLLSSGRRAGIREGLPVVVGETLVGTIAEVGEAISRVRLLTDPGSRVWGFVLAGEERADGVVTGTGGDHLVMDHVEAGIGGPGDIVFTGSGDERIPRGLLVGTVRRMDDIERNGIAEIEVAPAIRAERIWIVNVLAPEEE